MKTKVDIDGIDRDRIGRRLNGALRKICPVPGKSGDRSVTLMDYDPKLAQILELLTGAGFVARRSYFDGPKAFRLQYTNIFDESDLNGAEYLHFYPTAEIYPIPDRRGGPAEVLASNLQNKKLVTLEGHWIVVSAELRRMMEESGMLHAIYKPVIVNTRGKKEVTDQFYELGSDLILPPVSENNHIFIQEQVNPDFVHADWTHCYVQDPREKDDGPSVSGYQHRYNRVDLLSHMPFDVAVSHEHYIMPRLDVEFRNFVFSQRFRQFCLANRIPGEWIPIQIDD